MQLDADTRARKEREHERLLAEMDSLELASQREGGFLASDPRCCRWQDLGRQLDDLEIELRLPEYV